MAFTLQILHANDLEGGLEALENAPNFAAMVDVLEDEVANTLILSGGDNYIPGPFFNTAADFSMGGILTEAYTTYYTEVLGLSLDDVTLDLGRGAGRVDVSIMNFIGFDASAVGNHEFDAGTSAFADIIGAANDEDDGVAFVDWVGASFPYLSANLDFSGDDALGGLFTDQLLPGAAFDESPAEIQAGDTTPALAPATILEQGGERIGVIGATTQRVELISSTGGVEETTTGGREDMAALAAVIQPQIDRLVAEGVDKIILTSHLQQIALEKELAGLLDGVDVILAGGSNTLQADDTDALREGDTADETYPALTEDASGNPVAIVSTDGEYSYIGRLVVEFDDNGVINPASIDAAVSGAYATDAAGVAALAAPVLGATGVETSEAQEVAEVPDGPATGSFDVYVDGDVLVVTGTFSGLSSDLQDVSEEGVDPEGNPIDAIHIHQAAAGANGPVIRALDVSDNGDGSGRYAGRFALTEDELAALNAGELYVNIHTADFPAGELRGQLPGADGLAETAPSAEAAVLLSPTAALVGDLTDAVADIVEAADQVLFGAHSVFLDGRRSEVRTEETNLGNLTADANLATARAIDETVQVSFKNGGGIRSEIGTFDMDGNPLPGDGFVSQLDLQNSLRFDNNLTVFDVTAEGLLMILEHAVADTDTAAGDTPGRFPQVAGLRFSFDETGPAQELATDEAGDYVVGDDGLPEVATPGGRIQSVVLVDPETGAETAIVQDGALTGAAPETIRMVSLDFLVETNGDGYPFQELVAQAGSELEYLVGDGTLTTDDEAENRLGEQQALGDYMAERFPDAGSAFSEAETGVLADARIVQLARNGETDLMPTRVATGAEEVFDLDGGAFVLTGDLADFDGDRIVGIGSDDLIRFTGEGLAAVEDAVFGDRDVTIGDTVIDIPGVDFEAGDFLEVAGPGAVTARFVEFLPTLEEAEDNSAAIVPGIPAPDYLTATEMSEFTVTVDAARAGAAFSNMVGVYEVDTDGDIIDVRILAENAKNGGTFTLGDVEAGHQLGFFVVADGFTAYGPVGDAEYGFVDSATGGQANVFEGGGVTLTRDGQLLDRPTFHAFDAGLNPGGEVMATAGLGDDFTLDIGFEDIAGGDDDYQDVVLSVDHAFMGIA